MRSLDAVFAPNAIAVIGASTTPGKVGHDIFVNILKGGFTGTLYPVNPDRASRSLSVRAYPSIKDDPRRRWTWPSSSCRPRRRCRPCRMPSPKGVKGDRHRLGRLPGGRRRGAARSKTASSPSAARPGCALIGPNCLGVINPLPGVQPERELLRAHAQGRATSPSSPRAAPCARRCSISPRTATSASPSSSPSATRPTSTSSTCCATCTRTTTPRSSCSTSRSCGAGRSSSQAVKEITCGDYRPKPVLVIKSGRTSAGAQAAASHTGSLSRHRGRLQRHLPAGRHHPGGIDRRAVRFRHAPLPTRTKANWARCAARCRPGNRVAIVTNAGGPGIVATDMTMFSRPGAGPVQGRDHRDPGQPPAQHRQPQESRWTSSAMPPWSATRTRSAPSSATRGWTGRWSS
ncbi:MAG: CoA-binding protein [Desulfobacterales bacterium]|nr:CoA-binding protein [Desulfobacterales bacterium]